MGSDALNLTKDEVKILKALHEKKSELIKKDIGSSKKEAYESLIKGGLIQTVVSGKSTKYKITAKGVQYFESNKDGLLALLVAKKTTVSSTKKDNSETILIRLDTIENKLDRLMELIQKTPSSAAKPLDVNDGLKTFEIALKEEYKKLKERDFLGDGSVWHQELKRIVMGKYGYQDYQFDEMLQTLKKQKLGMISMSQGKEKTWIEIKE